MVGKKKTIIIAVCITIIVLLILCAGVYYTKAIHKINKIDKSKDVVYTSYERKADEYTYSIPYINIDSSDAGRINKEIEDYYIALADKCINNSEEGTAVITGMIEYKSYINKNILSIVILSYYDNDYVQYKVYNIDMYKGTEVTNSELIASKKITEEDFLNKLKELYKNKFITLYGTEEFVPNRNSVETELQKLYAEAYNQTISEGNYSMETPMFLNGEGKISVVAKIYSLAGAIFYYYIIDTNM